MYFVSKERSRELTTIVNYSWLQIRSNLFVFYTKKRIHLKVLYFYNTVKFYIKSSKAKSNEQTLKKCRFHSKTIWW